MSTTKPQEVYRLSEAPTHPLAAQYRISKRQFERAVQAGRISYARPGGLYILFTDEDITEFILGSRTHVVKP
ncbi:hypothetical protein [Rathayibacter agropyri]|uniref:hypothetical protein n=1 Tax=Rathayibacter agropyri TaxID=1634927 RepID=UPI001563A2A4|nr:hypothetical protein [Rathayibacter agropyri]NRD08408.1 hypothetical protein [Rathayibacter agropyri]